MHREIYPQPPLELVVAEIRYPFAPRLKQPDVCDAIQLALEEVLPVRRNQQLVEFAITPEGQTQKTTEVFRLVDRAGTHSALISPDRTVVETTRYIEFADLLSLITGVLDAIVEHRAIPAIERLGLRYIDEIRVPGPIDNLTDWADWIAADLMAPITSVAGAMSPIGFQGMLSYATGQDMALNFRYGAANGPGVIAPDGALRRRRDVEPGPFFLLDIDSYWQAPTADQALDADVKEVARLYSALHAPTGTRFQSSITEKARQLFRGDGS
ncbi:TIGR04255 family protein [Nonomuraea sp. bgisy101]|uniref:TIGR04255 family protein n=1 Tax=Nonomuraea sp. bgisy101 TaxID=3413784 RepID=UPI003D721725